MRQELSIRDRVRLYPAEGVGVDDDRAVEGQEKATAAMQTTHNKQ
ncbi:hypothetical protein [Halorubrum sp. DTA98]